MNGGRRNFSVFAALKQVMTTPPSQISSLRRSSSSLSLPFLILFAIHDTTIGTYCATSQVRARYLQFLGRQAPPNAAAKLKSSQLCSATLWSFQRTRLHTLHATTIGTYCVTSRVRARCLNFLGRQAPPPAATQLEVSQMCSATL